jgi:hypothetical protein
MNHLTIDEMLGRPGIYEAANPAMHRIGCCIRVEVDAAGNAYQLDPNGQRDGLLAREGWTDDAFAVRVEVH